jgi:hypothetical protein
MIVASGAESRRLRTSVSDSSFTARRPPVAIEASDPLHAASSFTGWPEDPDDDYARVSAATDETREPSDLPSDDDDAGWPADIAVEDIIETAEQTEPTADENAQISQPFDVSADEPQEAASTEIDYGAAGDREHDTAFDLDHPGSVSHEQGDGVESAHADGADDEHGEGPEYEHDYTFADPFAQRVSDHDAVPDFESATYAVGEELTEEATDAATDESGHDAAYVAYDVDIVAEEVEAELVDHDVE